MRGFSEEGVEVHVTNLYGDGLTYELKGYIAYDGKAFDFDAIAFGRYGGQNFSVSFPEGSSSALSLLGLTSDDIEELILIVQRKLVNGDLKLEIDTDEVKRQFESEYGHGRT